MIRPTKITLTKEELMKINESIKYIIKDSYGKDETIYKKWNTLKLNDISTFEVPLPRSCSINDKIIFNNVLFLNLHHEKITLSDFLRYMNMVIDIDKLYATDNNEYNKTNFINILNNLIEETLFEYKEELIKFFKDNKDYYILLDKNEIVYKIIQYDIDDI